MGHRRGSERGTRVRKVGVLSTRRIWHSVARLRAYRGHGRRLRAVASFGPDPAYLSAEARRLIITHTGVRVSLTRLGVAGHRDSLVNIYPT